MRVDFRHNGQPPKPFGKEPMNLISPSVANVIVEHNRGPLANMLKEDDIQSRLDASKELAVP